MCLAVEERDSESASVGRRSECSGWYIHVEEFGQIGGGRTSENLVAEATAFVFDPLFNREPVKFLKERGTRLRAWGFTDESGSRILKTL